MKIDGNEKEKAALTAYDQGDRVLAARLEEEFTEELRLTIANGEDYCSCTSSCEKHGNCVECVAAHRGHQGHLPACFREMVNQRLCELSGLTEHTVIGKIKEERRKDRP